ncbi:carbohydrate ABC transporter permease [Cohnella herbarum]|uniref:Carbohydrate ABC transporter permease n=1 Tax=Cohnella herbarum TaxID=2728023 RepID=A0A7Z2VFC0_9BACL|nr:carbohydrate ABC transporter permease [Cohnella herbarum]QJD81910.1 carbohydrate ABC transporter permease [Cohnella herbarum]
MVQPQTLGSRLITASIYSALALMAALCIMPILNVLAVSFSSNTAIDAGKVSMWPVDFTTTAYNYVAQKKEFLASILVSLKRVALGTVINMVLTLFTAYPLSKEVPQFRLRTWYAWIFVFTMLFAGGLVPSYLLVKELGLMDTLWALVLPGAVPVFNVILLLNFIRALPKELLEAGFIDGAGHVQILWRVVAPLSLPALATVGLFTIVGHWNEWFGGLIYMNDPIRYPLASYLQTVVVRLDLTQIRSADEWKLFAELNDRAVRAAQIFLGALPIFCVYPFLQRYFMSGIVMGSVKE